MENEYISNTVSSSIENEYIRNTVIQSVDLIKWDNIAYLSSSNNSVASAQAIFMTPIFS